MTEETPTLNSHVMDLHEYKRKKYPPLNLPLDRRDPADTLDEITYHLLMAVRALKGASL